MVEGREFFDAELLGAEVALGPGGYLVSVEGGEVVAEGFAFLAEGPAGEKQNTRRVGGRRPGSEAHGGGVDFGGRGEGSGRDSEEKRGGCEQVGLYREIAVVASSGLGGETLRDFALHQQYGPAEERPQREDLVENGRGDVVGQVAGDDGRSPLGEVRLEDVRLDDGEAGQAEAFGEGVIQLDRDDARGAGQEVFGQFAAAWADLNDERLPLGTRSSAETLKDRTLGKKMLSESPPQGVPSFSR